MTTDTVPQTVLFPDLFDKPLFAQFNQEQASSDGGAILLKAAERIYGLVKAFAGCLFDLMLVPVIQWAIHRLDPEVEILEPWNSGNDAGASTISSALTTPAPWSSSCIGTLRTSRWRTA